MLLYYCLYWGMLLSLLVYKRYNGSLTDEKEAAIADLQSFVHHGLEPPPLEETTSTEDSEKLDSEKLDSKASTSTDLEAGILSKVEENGKNETGEGPVEVIVVESEQPTAT